MALPLTLREVGGSTGEWHGETRDVSFRGVYFFTDTGFEIGSRIDFVLTLPKRITLATDVHIHCAGLVVRVEPHNGQSGVAAQIDKYDFLPQT